MLRLALLLCLLAPAALAQVEDDFSDGDFTSDPPWVGDTERFQIDLLNGDPALRSNGEAEPDTIALATASEVAFGRWTFRFRHEANLTNANGTRVYLVADTPDLKSDVQGYYVQLGTNNSDQVRLYRQDGPPDERAEIGASADGLVAGNTSEVFVEVTRSAEGVWTVVVDGEPVIEGVTDDTYNRSTHLGVWLKHSSANGAAFFWDDVLADPTAGDAEPPVLASAEALSATEVQVVFDEAVAGCDASLYEITPDVGQPDGIDCSADDGATYVLLLGAPLDGPTAYTVFARGVADLAGNVQPETSAGFFFGDSDTPEPQDIVINEIMYDPPDDSGNEWVELLNRTGNRTFDLSQLALGDATSDTVAIADAATPLGPGEYAVLANDPEAFEAAFPGVDFLPLPELPPLNNSGDTPVLLFAGEEIDRVPYEPSWGGEDASLERLDPDGPSAASSNWATSTDPQGGTPGEENSVFAPDTTPPEPVEAEASDDGQTVTVTFNEPLDPATVTSGAFSVAGGPAVTGATYSEDDEPTVTLTLAAPLDPGVYVLTVTGVEDLVGNATGGATVEFEYDPDLTPPALVLARALDETTVEVLFSEAVDPATAEDPANYNVSDGVGQPAGAARDDGEPERVVLTLAAPLDGPQAYTLTVRDVEDPAGNALGEETATFFFGEGAVPEPGDLVVNEIMYDPPDESANEYIELLNLTDETFDLADFVLADLTGEAPAAATPYLVGPGAFAVLVRDAELFAARFPDVLFVEVEGFRALNNGGDAVVLRYVAGEAAVVVDSVRYFPTWGGRDAALERRSPEGPSNAASNWGTSPAPLGGTPGAPNAVPPDTAPPEPEEVIVSGDGRTLTVTFNEPLDPATVTPGAFAIPGGPAVTAAEYDSEETVTLTLAAPLDPGDYTLVVTGVADGLGNAADGAEVPFSFDPDREPPELLEAFALDATTVTVLFSEPGDPATAGDPASYEVSGGIGQPKAVEVGPDGDGAEVRLMLAEPLTGPATYTLTVRGVEDLEGNALDEATAEFFFGEGDAAEAGDVVINEILYDPPDTPTNEYVELLNLSDKTFDLRDFTLADARDTVRVSAGGRFLLPGEYAALVRRPDLFEAQFPGVPFVAVADFPNLNNDGEPLVLAYEPGEAARAPRPVQELRREDRRAVIDSVFYRPSWGGTDASLERRDPEGPSNSAGNWGTSPDPRGGTPAAPNAVPPDTTPPEPEDVVVADDGRTLTVVFSEGLDPASVTAGAFAVDGSITPAGVEYFPDPEPVVELTLSTPLDPGEHTLTVTGIRDTQGNETESATLTFTFDPDREPPAVAFAAALDSATVRVRFTEDVDAVTATDPANYAISEGIGQPAETLFAPEGDQDAVDLLLATPLAEGVLYTLTITDVADRAGNALDEDEVIFLFGEADAPAPGELLVNEILYDPAEGGTEYIELLNATGSQTFDLSRTVLADASGGDPIAEAPVLLEPGGLIAVAADLAALEAQFGEDGRAIEAADFPSLNNTGDAVVLRFDGIVIDSLFYDPSWQRPELEDATGVALERLDPAAPSADAATWTSSLAPEGGTPGLPNSAALPPGEAPTAPGLTADPSPFDARTGTALRYTLAAEAGVVRIRIFDGAGRLVRTLEEAALAGNAVTGERIWNGLDDDGRPLRVGPYIVLLEALDLAGATTEAYREVVVLARDLR